MHSVEMQKSVSVQVDSDFALLLPSGVYEIKKMEPRSKLRKVILFCLLLSLFGMVAFGYFCPDQVCALSPRDRVPESLALSYAEAPGRPLPDVIAQPGLSYDEVLHDDFRFDLNAHDVMVFLHIQKTGGTSFGKHLVMDLDLKRPCNCQRARKRCHCFRPHSNEIWLFSRYSTGWNRRQNYKDKKAVEAMKDKSVKKKLAPEKELGLGEPYWPQGDWVFLRTMFPTTTVKNYRGTTTNPMGRTCDRICNHYYEQYGKICAHRYNTKKWQNEYRNFTNLCDLDHVNCNDTQIKPSWHLLHRGDCEELKEMVLLPRGNPKTILARAKKWAPYTYIPKFQPKRPIKLK